MLNVQVIVTGDRVIIDGLTRLAASLPGAINQGLVQLAKKATKTAKEYLSGDEDALPGSYPVPVRTGNLKRSMDWAGPGNSRDGFSAEPFTALLYDKAEYASYVHDGQDNNYRHGPRRFIEDSIALLVRENSFQNIFGGIMDKQISQRGLA